MCSYDSPLQRLDEQKKTKKTYFYVSLSSQHVYLCVGVNSCLHSQTYVVLLLFVFHCVCVCVCTLHTVCVCLHVPDGERGEEMAEGEPTTLSEACNVLGFGIPLARVYGKTNKKRGGALLPNTWVAVKLFGPGSLDFYFSFRSHLKQC